MNRKHNTDLTTNARTLRKNMTKEERHLWYDFLKSYHVRFLRQKVIDNYIVDFLGIPEEYSLSFFMPNKKDIRLLARLVSKYI